MKFKVKLAALSVMLCANAIADPVYLPPGPNLTYGASSNNQSIMSSITNPAAAAAQLSQEESQYRFGVLSSIGAGYEFGNVKELYNQIDGAQQTMTTPVQGVDLVPIYTTACTTTPNCSGPGEMAAFANNIANFVNTSAQVATLNNTILPALEKDGNATAFFGGHVPIMPLVVTKKNWGGSFVLDINASAVANMSFIQDPFSLSNAAATQLATDFSTYYAAGGNPNSYTPPDITGNLSNDSTLLVKAAVVGELGLGYSRPVLQSETGDLTAGVRAKYYQVRLVRDAQQLITSNGAQNTFNASQSYTSSSGMGLDLGTLWTAKRYRVGAWVNNINSPSFKYNTIDSATLIAAGYTKTAIINQLSADETYTMKPQLELEGAVYSESQNWVLNAGLDGNAVKDPVGRDFQWATVSAAYATSSWWIPGARVGYRTNLAGSKLSYVTGGLTMFKALSLDIAYGLDSITDNNGNKIPRSAMINLGLQMTF